MSGTAQRTIAGRYSLIELIGLGGMGEVWRGNDDMLGRAVAVKIISTDDGHSPDGTGRQRAIREARAASRLNHPAAVTVFDVVEEPGTIFIVMELVLGPNLNDVVNAHGPLDPRQVARIGLQLVPVLAAAHEAGIVHRDIKPSNVMNLSDGRIKVADFGIASLQDESQLTAIGTVVGSPAYMAPEQAAGHPTGPAMDLWGLGATLYFAVEGRAPYTRPSTAAVLAAVMTQLPDPVRLAGPLAPVLDALLVTDPARRAGLAQAHDLLAAVIGGPAVGSPGPATASRAPAVASPAPVAASPVPAAAPPAPAGAASVKAASRGRSWGLAAAIVLLLAIGGGVAYYRLVPDRQPAASPASILPAAAASTPSLATTAAPTVSAEASSGSGSGSGGPIAAGSQAATGGVELPLTDAAAPGQTLAQFFSSATNQAGGYSVGAPSTLFTVTAAGTTTYLEWPDGMFDQGFEVRKYPAAQLPLAQLRAHRTEFTAAHQGDGYHEIRLTSHWTYQGRPASAWEFTYTRNAKKTHVQEIAFTRGSSLYTVLYQINDVWWHAGGTTDHPVGFEKSFSAGA